MSGLCKNGKKVAAFDHNANIVDRKVTPEKLAQINDELTDYTLVLGWKRTNEPKHVKELRKILQPVINVKKNEKREARMIKAIRRKMIKSGKVLIITGTLHTIAFKKQFSEAHTLGDLLK